MYYRLAIQRGRGHLDRKAPWQWTSTALSSLQSVFQVLRLYSALPQEHLRLFSSSSREGLEEQLRQENSGEGSPSVTAAHFLQERLVHSSGATSTGGERQRIALARAFLKDAPILVLDEPTVHLDAITERAVLQSLRALRQNRTMVMVTHRLAGLDLCDEILVLQEGRIVERGAHESLLGARGRYWRMWLEQQPCTLK